MIMKINKALSIKDAEIAYAWEDGLGEGADRKAVEIALNMLKENESIDKIVKYTDLTIEQIEKLQADLD